MAQLTDEDFASIGIDFGICLPFVRRIFAVGTHDVNKQSLFSIGVSILILICSSENYELDSAPVCFGSSFISFFSLTFIKELSQLCMLGTPKL